MFRNIPGTKYLFYRRLHVLPLLWVISFYSTFCILSCKNQSKEEHPEYFDAVFNKFDSIRDDKNIAQLDSSFNAFPKPGIVDKAQKYIHKCLFYLQGRNSYLQAMLCADSLVSLLEERKKDPKLAVLYAKAFFLKGDTYVGMLNYDKAFENFVDGKKILMQSRQNDCGLFEYTARIASLHYMQGKYLQAVSYYKELCAEIKTCWQPTFDQFAELQGNLDNIGISYTKAGVYDSAVSYFNLALECIATNEHLFPANKPFMKLARAVVHSNLAEALSNQGKYMEAERLYIESSVITFSQDKLFTMATLMGLADTYIKDNELKKADSLFVLLKPIADSFPFTSTTVSYYKIKTDYYVRIKDINNAFICQQKFIAVKDSLQNRQEQFKNLSLKSEFEVWEQKSANALLQKDNKLKNMYVLIFVGAVILCIVIILLVLQILRRTRKHVNELKELNAKISRRNEDLHKAFISIEQSHNENSRITSIVAHDLLNPISAINNLTHALIKREIADTIKTELEFIKEACTDSINLIKEILHKEKVARDMQNELIDMRKLLEYCVDMLKPKAMEKNQELKLEAGKIMIKLNQQKMWRVISNILNNAIKFSPEYSDISIKLERKNNEVLLSIRDHGIGMPEGLFDENLDMFLEKGRAGTSGEESYGLGLSIANRIIKEHHGRLWYESKLGTGSVFYIELPI